MKTILNPFTGKLQHIVDSMSDIKILDALSGDWDIGDNKLTAGGLHLDDNENLELGSNTGGDVTLDFNATNASMDRVTGSPDFLIDMPIKVCTGTVTDEASRFGPTPGHVPGGDTWDMLISCRSSLAPTSAVRGLLAAGERAGTHDGDLPYGWIAGLNAFAHFESEGAGNTANFTKVSGAGGGTGGRYIVRHYGKGLITLATGVSTFVQLQSTGDMTEWAGLHSEGVRLGTGDVITKYSDVKAGSRRIQGATTYDVDGGDCITRNCFLAVGWNYRAGTFTTQYGLHVTDFDEAANNYAIFLEGNHAGAGIYFDQATEYINSDDDNHLDLHAADQIDMNDGGYFDSVGDLVVKSYTDATRPAAGTAGKIIFNTDDGQLNVDDGTNWTLPDGTAT